MAEADNFRMADGTGVDGDEPVCRDLYQVVSCIRHSIHVFAGVMYSTPGMKRALRSGRKVYGQLLEHARRHPHRECCGIVAGQDGLITHRFPVMNGAADPVRNYEITSKEMVRLMGELRD